MNEAQRQIRSRLLKESRMGLLGGAKCKSYKEVYSRKLGEPVSRCSSYGAGLAGQDIYGGCGACGGAEFGGAEFGGARPSKGLRHCIASKRVYSKKLGENVPRCARYAPGGGAIFGGRYRDRGSARNKSNPWQDFLREFAAENPDLAHNRAMLAKAAKEPYRQLRMSGRM